MCLPLALGHQDVFQNTEPQMERVFNFMGHEVQGRRNFRMQAVKWAVAKLQADKSASFFSTIKK